MRATVLSIGSELLRGDIVDSNATFLTRELTEIGFQVERVQQVGDDLQLLRETLAACLASADVTICTGGLGPTQDDLTREAIALVFGEDMREEPALVADLEARFAAMRRSMPARNRKQATLIPSARVIPNPRGTAPGWFGQRTDRVIVAMPGPPGEMRPMWAESVRPQLEALLPGHIAVRALMTFGLGESAVEERIDHIIRWHTHVTVATYAKEQGVEVHATARAPSAAEALALVEDVEQQLVAALGESVFGRAGDTLASAVLRDLAATDRHLAVLESCTGGAFANMITDTEGSSDRFNGGIVAYTREAKVQFGVDESIIEQHGLYSEETATAMAEAACRQLNTDVGVGITGVAGRELVDGTPPGTVFFAVTIDGISAARCIHRPGDRPFVKRFAAQCALDLVRRQLHSGDRNTR